jgi:hypothetical protein
MDIRKIIKETINSTLETFYLIVSKGESFVWSKNRLAGWSFTPIEELDTEDIFRSRFKNYDEAEDILNRFSKYRKENLLKYEPKIITVDFIMNKRGEEFPLIESQDLDWIRETPPYILGDFFEERDSICFDDGSKLQHMTCDVNISNDKIVFNVDKEDWLKLMEDIYEEDMWYLGPLPEYGSDYIDNNDYHEFDDEELGYIDHHFSEDQKRRLQEILNVVSPGTDVLEYMGENLRELPKALNHDPLKRIWWVFADNILHELGYVIQRNRWRDIGREYQNILDSYPGVEFNLGFDGDLTVTVPMKYVSENNEINLTNILYGISSILEKGWQDWFYDSWDTSGAEEGITDSINTFLDDAEEFLKDGESFDDYREYDKLVKSLGFGSSESRYRQGYIKKVNGKYWMLSEPNFETNTVTLKLFKGLFYGIPEESYKIPFDKIGEYISNYRLNLGESTDFDWIESEEPMVNPKQLRVGDTFRYHFKWHEDRIFEFVGVERYDGNTFKITSRKPRTKVNGGGIDFTFFKVDKDGNPMDSNRHGFYTGSIFFHGGKFTLVKPRPPVLGVDDY